MKPASQSKQIHSAQLVIYCDGACSGNPGPGGWGSIVIVQKENLQESYVKELAGFDLASTNNRMELQASLSALNFCLNLPDLNQFKNLLIFTDSVYVIRGVTQWMYGWKRKNWKTADNKDVSNQNLWQLIDKSLFQLKAKAPELKLHWNFVKGHSGDPGNDRCDEMAVASSHQDYVSLYSGSALEYRFDVLQLPEIKPLPDMKNIKSSTSSSNSSSSKKPWYISYVNGVFKKHMTWPECEALVKGRAAKYKKVTSETEELEIKKQWGIK